ncbi:MAG: hypothetical protein IPF87_00100 [Gemmatimonadetes bacterium]|nr:hypothetical protein [Gemmatimonadota bacterium]
MTVPKGWVLVNQALWAVFILTAALHMYLHVRAGVLTNYAADLVVPALLHVMLRRGRGRAASSFLRRWIGTTPARAGTVLFLASAVTEVSQRAWPHGIFSGRFDPWDLFAFGAGLALCYAGERWAWLPGASVVP